MGLEWHNRRRHPDGRFKKDEEARKPIMQVHIRIPYDDYRWLRKLAIASEEEMSQYVVGALLRRIERDKREYYAN